MIDEIVEHNGGIDLRIHYGEGGMMEKFLSFDDVLMNPGECQVRLDPAAIRILKAELGRMRQSQGGARAGGRTARSSGKGRWFKAISVRTPGSTPNSSERCYNPLKPKLLLQHLDADGELLKPVAFDHEHRAQFGIKYLQGSEFDPICGVPKKEHEDDEGFAMLLNTIKKRKCMRHPIFNGDVRMQFLHLENLGLLENLARGSMEDAWINKHAAPPEAETLEIVEEAGCCDSCKIC